MDVKDILVDNVTLVNFLLDNQPVSDIVAPPTGLITIVNI